MNLLIEAAVGFLGVLCGTAVSWGYMKARVDGHSKWIESHIRDHHYIDNTLQKHGEAIAVLKERSKGLGV